MSIYVYRSLMSDQMLADYERSSIRALAMSVCAYAGLQVSHFTKPIDKRSSEYVNLSTPNGFVAIALAYGDGEYSVYGCPNPASLRMTGYIESYQHLVTSKNLRYVMKAITSGKKSKGQFDTCVTSAANYHEAGLLFLRAQYRKVSQPKKRDFYLDLSREDQNWAARLALGSAQVVGVPEANLDKIRKLCDFLEQEESNKQAYISKTKDLFACSKWVVGLHQNMYRAITVGAIDGTHIYEHLIDFMKDQDLASVTPVIRPFRTYLGFDALPDEIRASLMSRLTMCNVAREGGDASSDPLLLIPRWKYHAYEETGSFSWRNSSDYVDDQSVQWFMCDM